MSARRRARSTGWRCRPGVGVGGARTDGRHSRGGGRGQGHAEDDARRVEPGDEVERAGDDRAGGRTAGAALGRGRDEREPGERDRDGGGVGALDRLVLDRDDEREPGAYRADRRGAPDRDAQVRRGSVRKSVYAG